MTLVDDEKRNTGDRHEQIDRRPCHPSCIVHRASCLVPRAKLDIEYLTVSDTTSEVVLSSTDLNEHRRLLGQLRKCGGQATIFKALKF